MGSGRSMLLGDTAYPRQSVSLQHGEVLLLNGETHEVPPDAGAGERISLNIFFGFASDASLSVNARHE